jgi:hypothetical protein
MAGGGEVPTASPFLKEKVMNIKNAIEMIEFGLNWKDTESQKFEFLYQRAEDSPCGTEACFAGWFAHTVLGEKKYPINACAEYLEISQSGYSNKKINAAYFFTLLHHAPWGVESGTTYSMSNVAEHMKRGVEWYTGKTYAELKAEYWIESGSWEDLKDIWIPCTEETLSAEYDSIPEVE